MKSTLRLTILGLTVTYLLFALPACSQLSECGNIELTRVSFEEGSCSILPPAQNILNLFAEKMRASPECRVVVMGNAGGSKPSAQLSWERVQAVIEHMSETNNIDRNRFIFMYDGEAANNSVTLEAAELNDERPSNVPPPFSVGTTCR